WADEGVGGLAALLLFSLAWVGHAEPAWRGRRGGPVVAGGGGGSPPDAVVEVVVGIDAPAVLALILEGDQAGVPPGALADLFPDAGAVDDLCLAQYADDADDQATRADQRVGEARAGGVEAARAHQVDLAAGEAVAIGAGGVHRHRADRVGIVVDGHGARFVDDLAGRRARAGRPPRWRRRGQESRGSCG